MASAAALLALLVAASAYAGSAGRLDHSFGDDGQFVLGRTFADASGLDIGSKGRIVFAGNHRDEFIVGRLRSDGRLDRAFADNGVATIPAAKPATSATAVAVDRNGGIVLAGVACTDDETACDVTVYRLTRTGQLNRGFGDQGMVTLDFPKPFNTDPSLELAPNHRILVEASTCPPGGTFGRKCNVGVARLKRDGSFDLAFGDNGTAVVFFKRRTKNCGLAFPSTRQNVSAMALDSRQRIVVLESCAGGRNAALARLKPNGDLDRSFGHRGHRGKVYKDVGMRAAVTLTVDSRNRIDVAGPKLKGFALARFKPGGKLDRRFGKDGKAVVTFASDPRGIDVPFGVGLDSRGRIVAGGRLGRTDTVAGFARFRPNGRADRRFGHHGGVIQKRLNDAVAIAIDSRNRIVAAGEKFSDVGHIKLVRLLG